MSPNLFKAVLSCDVRRKDSFISLLPRPNPTQVDRKLADTHINLEHLETMAKSGVQSSSRPPDAGGGCGEDGADSEQLAGQLMGLASRLLAKRQEEKAMDTYSGSLKEPVPEGSGGRPDDDRGTLGMCCGALLPARW